MYSFFTARQSKALAQEQPMISDEYRNWFSLSFCYLLLRTPRQFK